MSEGKRLNLLLLFYICLSLIGLFTVLMFALKAPTQIENMTWRKPLIGSIFALICIAGSIATLFPKKCSSFFNLQRKEAIRQDLWDWQYHLQQMVLEEESLKYLKTGL